MGYQIQHTSTKSVTTVIPLLTFRTLKAAQAALQGIKDGWDVDSNALSKTATKRINANTIEILDDYKIADKDSVGLYQIIVIKKD